MKKFRASKQMAVVSIFALSLLFLSAHTLYVWAQGGQPNPDSSVSPMVQKEHFTAEDINQYDAGKEIISSDTGRKANVLFLVDVGSAMLFTAKGKLPNWQSEYNKAVGNHTQKTNTANAITAQQMKECTFGGGGLPNTRYASYRRSRDGRDLDSSNNVKSNPDNYYNTGVLGYPANDSRLYKMKLVLWRMLDQSDLFSHLRFALSTTYQEESPFGVYVADFYKVADWDKTGTFPHGTGPKWATGPSTGTYGTSQGIEWGVDQSLFDESIVSNAYPNDSWFRVHRAYLRVPFGESTPSHISKFRKLINGVEDTYSDNSSQADFRARDPELIADGKTPLANSIFPATVHNGVKVQLRDTFLKKGRIYFSNHSVERKRGTSQGYQWFGKGSGEAVGTALDFFSPPISGLGASATAGDATSSTVGNFPIRDRCESNWLVIFTAGDDSSSYSSPEAVKDLYEYTKKNKVVRIKNPTLPASTVTAASNLELIQLYKPIRTMVIGFVDTQDATPTTVALRKTLNDMADYGDNGLLDGSASAYFANDVPGLIEAMRQVIDHIVAETKQTELILSSTSSLVAPSMSGADAQGFLPGYLVRSNDQWQGLFSHYTIAPPAGASQDVSSLDVTEDWKLEDLFAQYAQNNAAERRVYVWNWPQSTESQFGTLSQVAFPQLVSGQHPLAELMGVQNSKLSPTPPAGTAHPSNLLLRWVFGQDYNTLSKKSFARESVLVDMGNSGYSLMTVLPAEKAHGQAGYRDWIVNTANKRPPTIFFHTNDGLLHAVDPRPAASLDNKPWAREHWSFIPPNALERQRLAALTFKQDRRTVTPPGEEPRHEQTLSWINGGSQAGYTTDGAVYLYNLYGKTHPSDTAQWRTILVGSMGRGGAGLYAMDVTHPTDPSKVRFLWGIENQLYTYHLSGKKGFVQRWYLKNNGVPTAEYGMTVPESGKGYSDSGLIPGGTTDPYHRLGYNAPPPLVGTTLLRTATGNTPINVAVMASGFQYDLNLKENGLFGAAVYILNPLTGELHRDFDNRRLQSASEPSHLFTDADSSPISYSGSVQGVANPAMGMMLTPPAAIVEQTGGKESPLYLEGYITADNRGQIFEGSFKDVTGNPAQYADSAAQWHLRRIGTLRAPQEVGSDANYSLPYALTVARHRNGDLWLFGGTANTLARKVGEDTFSPTAKDGVIKNKSQFLFGFKRMTWQEAAAQTEQAKRVVNMRDALESQSLNRDISADSRPSEKRAWTIPLAKSYLKNGKKHLEEYLSTGTLLFNGELYASTFLPREAETSVSKEDCAYTQQVTVNGISRLYRLEALTGRGTWDNTPKYRELDGIKINGLTMATVGGKTRLFLSVTLLDELLREELSGKKNSAILRPGFQEMGAIHHTPTLISIDGSSSKDNTPLDSKGKDYWRMIFSR